MAKRRPKMSQWYCGGCLEKKGATMEVIHLRSVIACFMEEETDHAYMDRAMRAKGIDWYPLLRKELMNEHGQTKRRRCKSVG